MIRWIQYLRGIAAMMVVWQHSVSQVTGGDNFIPMARIGGYGVQLFFVISGFIMLVTTWDKPITPVEFILNRIRRVVPLYWLATLLMVGIAIASPALFKTLKWDAAALVKSLLFVPYESLSFPGTISPLLVPGWSLNYEMFFYVLFALALLLKKQWRLPATVGTLVALIVGGKILHPSASPAQVYTDPLMLEFAAGMILGRLWVMKKHSKQHGGHVVLMALGDASYSIYLTHIFTLGVLRVVWGHFVPVASQASSFVWMGLALTASAVVGWACFRMVERPIIAVFRRAPGVPVRSAT